MIPSITGRKGHGTASASAPTKSPLTAEQRGRCREIGAASASAAAASAALPPRCSPSRPATVRSCVRSRSAPEELLGRTAKSAAAFVAGGGVSAGAASACTGACAPYAHWPGSGSGYLPVPAAAAVPVHGGYFIPVPPPAMTMPFPMQMPIPMPMPSPTKSRRPPMPGPSLHRSTRSETALASMRGSSSGSDPTTRNLVVDFFPGATTQGQSRTRRTGSCDSDMPVHLMDHIRDDDDVYNSEEKYGSVASSDDSVSTSSSFESQNNIQRQSNPMLGNGDDASTVSGSGSYSVSGSFGKSGDSSSRKCRSRDRSSSSYSDHEEEVDRGYYSEQDIDQVKMGGDEGIYLCETSRDDSLLSLPHTLDKEQLQNIFRRDGHKDFANGIPLANEIFGSQYDLRRTNSGPPPLIETPASEASSIRKQYSRLSLTEAVDDEVDSQTKSAVKDDTLSDRSNLHVSGQSIPRAVFYTPQVSPDAKGNLSPAGNGDDNGKVLRKNHQQQSGSTPLSLQSIKSAKIDFLCYGHPDEVPSEEEDLNTPLSPGSYLNTSVISASADLHNIVRSDRAVNTASIISPSPKHSKARVSTLTPENTMYSVEDVVRASAAAISRVLDLSLSDQVDGNMEAITKRTYEILRSQNTT